MRHVEAVIDRLQTGISNYISQLDGRENYRVHWRVYHGWHQGKTKTQDRILFDKFLTTASARTLRNISFSSDFELSGTLSCRSSRPPIVDTLRMDTQTRETKQKMVDALLVCDLLHLARTREHSLLVIIANDDDFVPALHTAEAWKARVIMLHNREYTNDFLSLNGIAARITP